MDKALKDAITNGNVSSVTKLLDKGFSVDCCDEEGTNALHIAAANGDENIVRLLLSRGASLKATNHYGWTALMAAAYYGHIRICFILIQHKADVNAQNILGATAVDCAARCGHLQVVQLLMDVGAEINLRNRFCSDEGLDVSPLMKAAQYGHENVVQLLIQNGAEVNYFNEKTRWNSLMLAAMNGHSATVEILVDRGADTNFANILEQTPLQIAENRQKKEVEEYLEQRTAIRPKTRARSPVKPTIIEAARSGDLASVRDLLDHNESDITAVDKDGATPLMYAAMGGHLDVVQLLVERGTNIDAQDKKSGWTALMQATYYGHWRTAKFLIDHSANVTVQAKDGCTAFDVASIIGDTEVLRLLASVTMQMPSRPKNNHSFLAWASLKPKDFKMDKEIISVPKDNVNRDRDLAKNKNWWSKVSSRFRNLNLVRTLRVPSNSKLMVLESPTSEQNGSATKSTTELSDTDSVGTTRSLEKALDTTRKVSGRDVRRPKILNFDAPVSKLPDDVIGPVLPPPSMSTATFQLTRMQRHTQMDTEDSGIPQVPSLCVNGESIRDGSGSKRLDDNLDNISSVSGYSSRSRFQSSSDRLNFSGSPESSFSTGSYYSSHSNNSGSRTLRLASPTAPDAQHLPLTALATSVRKKSFSRGAVSPSPSPHSVGSTYSTPDIQHLTPRPRKHTRVKSEETSAAAGLNLSSSSISLPANSTLDECEEDLGAILKSLSLEEYNSIFEAQEVDMEAFLELNDRDLKELGVKEREPRLQILALIDKLNSGKDRERQQMEDMMATFQSYKSQFTSGYASSPSSSGSMSRWAFHSSLRNQLS